jgi:recombination protein RecA
MAGLALVSSFSSQEARADLQCRWGAAPRGVVTEVAGSRSTGRTAFIWAAVAEAVRAGEVCAVVDASSRVDAAAAERAGLDWRRVLWVRCQGRTEAAFRAADLLLHGGGFGVVVLDLCDVSDSDLRRVPLSYWFRFRRAIEGSATGFLVAAARPVVGTCAALQISTGREGVAWRGELPFPVLDNVTWRAEARKPVRGGVERVVSVA